MICILRYIKSALGKRLLYQNKGNTQVFSYSDDDWVGSLANRKSTSGYYLLVGGNLIS